MVTEANYIRKIKNSNTFVVYTKQTYKYLPFPDKTNCEFMFSIMGKESVATP